MRIKGATAKKNCWNCKVSLGDNILLDEDFKTLKEISTKLNLSYAQISELGPNGRKKKTTIINPYKTNINIEIIGNL